MSFYVYVLGSLKKPIKTYVGWTNDLKKRIFKHNSGKGAKFTRGRKWKLLYSERLLSKSSALKKEYELKKNNKFRKNLREKINE
jgi:putative endonuclease